MSETDIGRMMADADPMRKIMDIVDPPHLRELRQRQELLAAPAERMRKSMGSAAATLADTVSAVERYRSPARDALDMIRARDPLREAAERIRGAVLPPAPALAPSADDAIRSPEDIGKRVRQARQAMGMTQQRFADLAGVGRRFLVELEKGKPTLEVGRVLAVCRAAGLKLVLSK